MTSICPQFNEAFDGDFYITRKSNLPLHQAPSHETNDVCFVKTGDKYLRDIVIDIPVDEEEQKYNVQLDTNEIKEVLPEDMLSTNPTAPKDDKDQPINHIYQWLKHGSKATMFLNEHWSTPKQGFLFQDATT
eukprot:CAMPEP_0184855652 /NCGR_PEP_ID=MMETSP0580-20130426/824_1 /TAXON_ID=1118495 /ORGANISM="Dactyliosolen fragilissimus" /LENGTH=131 /DNA_ID=CAMNT_0027350215 /DNA_START=170 /DNA_END=566 /DNA_ORIENTATION=-